MPCKAWVPVRLLTWGPPLYGLDAGRLWLLSPGTCRLTHHSADQATPLQRGGTVVGSSPRETRLWCWSPQTLGLREALKMFNLKQQFPGRASGPPSQQCHGGSPWSVI